MGTYFVPTAQDNSHFLTFALKTAGRPEALGGALREAIGGLDRELPVFDVKTMAERTEGALRTRRSAMLLSAGFGLVALFLSAIGIRMALGSSSRAIFELIIREGLLLVGAGFLLGAVGAFLLRRSLESQLFGVEASDPVVLGAVTLALGLVALLACALPARRATRIDPLIALSE